MISRVCILLAFATVVTAINAECEADNTDSINLLQTSGTAELLAAKPSGDSADKQAEVRMNAVWDHAAEVIAMIFGASADEQAGLNVTAVGAEFIAMILFVIIGCGSAMAVANESGWVLQVALSFGLGITVLAYSIGHFSGGHINPAVTFGLVLAGKCSIFQGCMNVIAQLLGATVGASLLMTMIPEEKDKTGGLGSNQVGDGLSKYNALAAEFIGTFLLVFVVFQTAISPHSKANREMAALAIGLAVFLAHCILIPIDGCSINPARSFGPALVRKLCYTKNTGSFGEMWIFFAGPLLGAAGAALLSTKLLA